MKKLMYLELGVLAVLLVATIIVCSYLASPAFSPDGLYTGSNNVSNMIETQTDFTPTWKTYPEDRQITAQQYFVYNCKKKDFITISGQKDDRIYPAGVTKLFAAYVAMQHLHPDTEYTVGDALDLVTPGSPVAGLKKGNTLTARRLLQAVVLPGGSDAAYVLACVTGKEIAKDSTLSTAAAIDVFVKEMNTRAKALGMTSTNFINPDGTHNDNHYTTFRDLTIMGSLCMDDTFISQVAVVLGGTPTINGETLVWKNANALIDPDSPFYCPYATGLAAGQVPDTGSYLLASFKKGSQFLLVGVFGCPSETDRFDDTLQLFNQTLLN